ncbi:MAG: T9SS type A sorting domain-containing protein [Flavobacteriales bacterium]|nr:T9SS type A sorting domain-containing protein [Flavobacteriales bacterium]
MDTAKKLAQQSLTVLAGCMAMLVQAQTWQWARPLHHTNGVSVGCDAQGNISFIGRFGGGGAIYGNDTLPTGLANRVLGMLDGSGNFLWAELMFTQVQSYLVDASEEDLMMFTNHARSDRAILAYFRGDAYLDTAHLVSATNKFLLAQFNADGSLRWRKLFGGLYYDLIVSGTMDEAGSIYLAADFEAPGPGPLDGVAIPSGEVILKFDSSGTCQWATRLSTTAFNQDIAVMDDLLVAAGWTPGGDTVWVDTLAQYIPGPSGLISRWDPESGHVIWVTAIERGGMYDCTIGSDRRLYINGLHSHIVVVGNDTLAASPGSVPWFGCFDETGQGLWAKGTQVSTLSANPVPMDIQAVDSTGFYSTGRLELSPFDISFDGFVVSNPGWPYSLSAYVVRYDRDGHCLGVASGTRAFPWQVLAFPDGGAALMGQYDAMADLTLGSILVPTAQSGADHFIARLDAITGVEDLKSGPSQELHIYANPNRGSFTLRVPKHASSLRNAVLRVYDNQGVQVRSFNLAPASTQQVEMGVVPAGLYLLELHAEGRVWRGRMVVAP